MTATTRQLRLVAREVVTDHGTQRTTWLVHNGERWESVLKADGVKLETLDSGPGTIWETAAELRLPIGNWVQRIEALPHLERYGDPLQYLERERRGARLRLVRTYYTVTEDGGLKRQGRELAPL